VNESASLTPQLVSALRRLTLIEANVLGLVVNREGTLAADFS